MMQLTDELKNLLPAIQMPIVMVDNALTVRARNTGGPQRL